MTGLISKDFIVFRKRFTPLYRLIFAAALALVILLPNDGGEYIAVCLPAISMAFLAEIVKVDELSEWKDYLPVLPVTGREVVLSRYVFSWVLLLASIVISVAACAVSAAIYQFSLTSILPHFILGIWLGVLMMCVSIPTGYLFKNEICTGSMLWCLIPFGITRGAGLDVKLMSAGGPVVAVLLLLSFVPMLCASYGAALWVYTTKRYQKLNAKRA